MRYSAIVSALFAVTVVAVPIVKVVDDVVIVAITVTEGTPAASSAAAFLEKHKHTPAAAPAKSTPPPAPEFIETKPSPAAAPPPPAKTPESSGASDGSPMSGGVSLLTTANKWRKLYHLDEYTWSDEMAQNSAQTGQANGGVTENHSLVPGINTAQVITPGEQTAFGDLKGDTPFELAWVSWLCEVPGDSELSAGGNGVDQCSVVSSVLNMEYADTGHHDILVSSSYTQMGCAFTANPASTNQQYQGLWVCGFT